MTTWAQDAADALDALGDSPTADQARVVTDRFPNVDVLAALASRGGGGGGAYQTATVTLTNAQILALPTTPIQVVAAPGVGNLLVVDSAVMALDATGGVYSDFDSFNVFLNYGSGGLKQASNLYDEANNGAFADDNAVNFIGIFQPIDAGTNQAGWFGDATNVVNVPITVWALNGAAGDLAGGDAANTLKVVMNYYTVAVS